MSAHKHTPMVVAAARAICRRDSELCNVDFEDNWKLYGDGFLADAQAALEAIAVPELLEACQAARALTPDWTHTAGVLDAAVAKATGESA